MSLVLSVECDTCGKAYDGPRGVTARLYGHLLRHDMRGQGWLCAVRSVGEKWSNGAKDYCPACREGIGESRVGMGIDSRIPSPDPPFGMSDGEAREAARVRAEKI